MSNRRRIRKPGKARPDEAVTPVHADVAIAELQAKIAMGGLTPEQADTVQGAVGLLQMGRAEAGRRRDGQLVFQAASPALAVAEAEAVIHQAGHSQRMEDRGPRPGRVQVVCTVEISAAVDKAAYGAADEDDQWSMVLDAWAREVRPADSPGDAAGPVGHDAMVATITFAGRAWIPEDEWDTAMTQDRQADLFEQYTDELDREFSTLDAMLLATMRDRGDYEQEP